MSIFSAEGRSFLKMHGLGNDFVVLDARVQPLTISAEQVIALADRRTGIGCDQLIVIGAASDADVFMSIYNADGSQISACGNATRCVGWLLLRETGRDCVTIRTRAGLLDAQDAGDGRVRVDMGPAYLDAHDIPLAGPMDTLSLPVSVGGYAEPVGVGMGNPHAVFFVPDADMVPLADVGPKIEHHPLFPERTNVEFAQILAPDRIRMRVWERGTGITKACGTGACATLVAAVRRGLAKRHAEIVLDGGVLIIEWREDGHVAMTGEIALVFRGSLIPSLLP